MKKLMMLATAAVTLAGTPALANKKDGAKYEKIAERIFQKMDTNGDRMVSHAEHDLFAEAMFQEADRDDSDSLSFQEVLAQKKKQKEMHMGATGQTETP